jgi:hypothetical protein
VTDSSSQLAQLRTQAVQLKADWSEALPDLEASPSVYQPYLPNATLSQVTEAISTTVFWLDRARAPRGFAPAFHLAQSLAATALPSALNAVQHIRGGEYGFFATLLVAINQIASSLHSMLVFGDRNETREAIATLGGTLAESLSLVDTAQRELAHKVTALAEADALSARIVAAAEEAPKLIASAATEVAAIEDQKTAADNHIEAIEEALSQATDTLAKTKELYGSNDALQGTLKAQQAALSETIAKTQKQLDLITALLPQAASAGLASSFSLRVGQVEGTKRFWIGTFMLSVVGLAVLGILVHTDIANLSAQDLSVYLLRRLPIAGPLIWLGWFSAVQYGNTLRVQEDYAFKEATSKAFEGYRDHLEHLASVSLSEGNTAMTLLAARTIEVLSHEPMRVFGKAYRDASPASSLVELLALKPLGKD